jgi:4-hydroxybenzoyl-CoA thioesterase
MITAAPDLGMTPFTLGLPVRFTHTDPAGFVFFPRYFEFLQAVTEEWFNQSLKLDYADLIMGQRRGLPTAHTECDFKKPCRLGERIDFTLYLERIGRSSMRVHYVGRVNGEQRMYARSDLVVIALESGRAIPFDDDLRARLEAYKAGCEAE